MKAKAVRGWLMYDWANSAFATTMMAAVLPIYYESVAGVNLTGNTAANYWGYTQTVAMLLVAIMSPILGAIADHRGSKGRFLLCFMILGSVTSMAMALVGEGAWLLASILYIGGSIGFSAGNTFYDAMLTELVPEHERDMVSSKGYAYGYIGGGLLLAVNIAMIEGWEALGFPDKTTATQVVFITVGLWWLLFSIPLFRHYREKSGSRIESLASTAMIGFRRVGNTFTSIRRYPELLKYMASYWFFNDGINTVIIMATIYGSTIGIETVHLIVALLITQFVGFPCTLLFGKFAGRVGAKRALFVSLSVYVCIVMLGYFMAEAWHFYALAILVGVVQGGSQALARSLYANLVPAAKAAEFFGFLSLSSKFSSVAGPFTFAIVGTITGSSRLAVLSLVSFFIIGMVLLKWVDFAKGRREALAGGQAG